ncbi:MAG: hypothetical protein F9K26_12715 [Ignavibacteriaceae bacterium]|nr:MAG: hypothetical protein F9K26_12715 [Ignavibacteriaceae bacterium]
MDAGTAITLKEATQKLVDAINKTLPSILDSELSVEVIELPEGGLECRYQMSEEVQAIFESVAAMRGMTINEFLKWTVLQKLEN